MAESVRELVIQAFQRLLEGMAAPNVPGTFTVYRERRTEVPAEKALPALNLKVSTAAPPELICAGVERTILRFAVEGQVKADGDAALSRQLTDLTAAIARAVAGDPTLGGLAVDSTIADQDTAAPDDEGIGGIGAVLVAVDVEVWTRPGDPYALAP